MDSKQTDTNIFVFLLKINAEPHELLELGANGHDKE